LRVRLLFSVCIDTWVGAMRRPRHVASAGSAVHMHPHFRPWALTLQGLSGDEQGGTPSASPRLSTQRPKASGEPAARSKEQTLRCGSHCSAATQRPLLCARSVKDCSSAMSASARPPGAPSSSASAARSSPRMSTAAFSASAASHLPAPLAAHSLGCPLGTQRARVARCWRPAGREPSPAAAISLSCPLGAR